MPQDTRNSIEDMEIRQLRMKRLARDSADFDFRDKQVEVSDALTDEVGALLTESGGAEIIEICPTARFKAKAGDLGLRPGFCSRFVREQIVWIT